MRTFHCVGSPATGRIFVRQHGPGPWGSARIIEILEGDDAVVKFECTGATGYVKKRQLHLGPDLTSLCFTPSDSAASQSQQPELSLEHESPRMEETKESISLQEMVSMQAAEIEQIRLLSLERESSWMEERKEIISLQEMVSMQAAEIEQIRFDATETLQLEVEKYEMERTEFSTKIKQLEDEVKGLGHLLNDTKKRQLQKIDDETSQKRSTLEQSMAGSDQIKEQVVMTPYRLKVVWAFYNDPQN